MDTTLAAKYNRADIHPFVQVPFRLTSPSFPNFPGMRRAIIAVAVIVYLALAMLSAWHRLAWSDEGWYADPAYNLAKHGRMSTTVFDPATTSLTRIDQHTYWIFPLSVLAPAAWLTLLPATLFWTRLLTIVWGLIAVGAFYRILAALTRDVWIATLGTSLLALDYNFIDNAGFARPDMMCLALGLCGIAFYLDVRERSLPVAMFLANGCIAASGLTHPNGIFHLAGLATLFVALDRKRLNAKILLAAICPYLIALALWVPYILQDVPAFRDQMSVNGSDARWTRTLNPFRILWNEWRERYAILFGFKTGGAARIKAVNLISYLAGIATLLGVPELRKRTSSRLLLALLGVYFIALSLFNQKLTYYFIHILPWIIAALTVAAAWWWNRWPRLRPALALWLAVLILVQCAGITLRAFKRSARSDEANAIAFLHSRAPNAQLIIGSAALLFGLKFDTRLVDDLSLDVHSPRVPDAIVIGSIYRDVYDGWNVIKPDEMRLINERLSHYILEYHNSEYQVYLPRH